MSDRKTLTAQITVDREWFHWAEVEKVKAQITRLVYDALRRVDGPCGSICTARVETSDGDSGIDVATPGSAGGNDA